MTATRCAGIQGYINCLKKYEGVLSEFINSVREEDYYDHIDPVCMARFKLRNLIDRYIKINVNTYIFEPRLPCFSCYQKECKDSPSVKVEEYDSKLYDMELKYACDEYSLTDLAIKDMMDGVNSVRLALMKAYKIDLVDSQPVYNIYAMQIGQHLEPQILTIMAEVQKYLTLHLTQHSKQYGKPIVQS